MKLIKALTGLLLCLILIASTCCFMSSIALERSTSSEAIHKAIEKTDAVNVLSDQILANLPYEIDSTFKEPLESILKSEPMLNFYSDFLESAIQSAIAGEDIESINQEALSYAIDKGFEDFQEKNLSGLSEQELYLFNMFKDRIVTQISSTVGTFLSQFDIDLLSEDMSKTLDYLRMIVSKEFRYGSALLAILSFIAIFLVLIRNGAWLRWSGGSFIVCGIIYAALSGLCKTYPLASGDFEIIDRMLMVMFEGGTMQTAMLALTAGAALMGVGIVYKIIRIFI